MRRVVTEPGLRPGKIFVFLGVALPVMVSGALILRQNQEVKMLLAGSPRVITVGARLEPLNGYKWNSHGATLVLALRSGCPFCQASMGFYGRVKDDWRSGRLKAYPLVLYPDAAAEARPEIRNLWQLTSVDYAGVGILSTPTVLLVDSRGSVLRKWTGQLPASQEEIVLAAAREPPLPRQ